MELFVVILVSIIIALIVCMGLRSAMKTAKLAKTAHDYIPRDGFKLTAQGDVFLYTTTSRRKIEKDTSSSSGGANSSSGAK